MSVTPDEVREVIGSQFTDDQINTWLEPAYDILFSILCIDTLDKAERTQVTEVYGDTLYMMNYNIDDTQPFTVETMGGTDITSRYTWRFKDKRTVEVFDMNGQYRVQLPYCEVRVTYTAGYDTWPKQLKNVIALIVGGGLTEQQKLGDTISYSIGSKSVTFRDDNDAKLVDRISKQWLMGYKRIKIFC